MALEHMRWDPESIMASPEKAELVRAIEDARIAKCIEHETTIAQNGGCDAGRFIHLLLAIESGKWFDLVDPTWSMKLNREQRIGFERAACLAIEHLSEGCVIYAGVAYSPGPDGRLKRGLPT